MRSKFTQIHQSMLLVFAVIGASALSVAQVNAQTTDTSLLYGMTKSGLIYQINVTNANCGTAINPAYPTNDTANQANALGYDSANKSFYYFKRNFGGGPEEFVSYNTVTQSYTTLAASPITSIALRGCVNPDGTGYYCMDENGHLCYYNIPSNAWTIITSNYIDNNDNNITSNINVFTSGDIAFDANGNLWVLCSSSTKYALYEFPGAIPTTAVDTLSGLQYVPDTTSVPRSGFVFGGIAFNSTGQIYLSTGSPDNRLYILQDNLALSLIGTLSADAAGSDLTSNNFPVSSLPVGYLNFDGVLQNNEAVLNWQTVSEINNKGFNVQKSTDGQTFANIGYVQGHGTSQIINNYIFADPKLLSGDNYYRLQQVDLDGNFTYSGEIKLEFSKFDWSILGNPSNNTWVQLQLDKTHEVSLQVVSLSGDVILTVNKGSITQGTYGIPLNLGNAAAGMYVVRLMIDGKSYSKNMVK